MTYYMYFDKVNNTFHIFGTKQKIEEGLVHKIGAERAVLEYVFAKGVYEQGRKFEVVR
jgi:hypothetical protein